MSSAPPRLAALVTGASRGIGRAIAIELAARGVRVALHYNSDPNAAQGVCAELAGTGHAIFAADLSDSGATERLWKASSQALGRIDLVINNAGIYLDHPPLEVNFAAWQLAWHRTIATNLFGPANLCMLAAQAMSASPEPSNLTWGRGRIVNISSRGAFRGEPFAPAYGASKAGLNSLSQSLALALAPRSVYVYCIAPGWVATDMATAYLAGPRGPEILAQHPLGRVATPHEIAQAAVFCGLDAPAAMTGSIIDVNGASYLRS